MDSMRLKCLAVSLTFYVLAGLRFWPMGLLTAIVPAIFVWHATMRCLEPFRPLDSMIETFLRRGGGD